MFSNMSPAPQENAQAEKELSKFSTLIFWPGGCLAESLSLGLSLGSLAILGLTLLRLARTKYCLRSRAKLYFSLTLLKAEKSLWTVLVVIPTQTSSTPLPYFSVTLTKCPLWANLTELVLWVCNSDLPETPWAQTGLNLIGSAWPSGKEALLVPKYPTPPEIWSKSPDMESCSILQRDSPRVPKDLLKESKLVLFLTSFTV